MANLGALGEVAILRSQTVNSTATTIAHGFGSTPDVVIPVVRNAAAHYCNLTATAVDGTNIVAIADATLTTCVDFICIFFKGLART